MNWEYRTIAIAAEGWFLGGKVDLRALTEKLNGLGDAGWELVNVFGTNQIDGVTRDVIAVLKRPASKTTA